LCNDLKLQLDTKAEFERRNTVPITTNPECLTGLDQAVAKEQKKGCMACWY